MQPQRATGPKHSLHALLHEGSPWGGGCTGRSRRRPYHAPLCRPWGGRTVGEGPGPVAGPLGGLLGLGRASIERRAAAVGRGTVCGEGEGGRRRHCPPDCNAKKNMSLAVGQGEVAVEGINIPEIMKWKNSWLRTQNLSRRYNFYHSGGGRGHNESHASCLRSAGKKHQPRIAPFVHFPTLFRTQT